MEEFDAKIASEQKRIVELERKLAAADEEERLYWAGHGQVAYTGPLDDPFEGMLAHRERMIHLRTHIQAAHQRIGEFGDEREILKDRLDVLLGRILEEDAE